MFYTMVSLLYLLISSEVTFFQLFSRGGLPISGSCEAKHFIDNHHLWFLMPEHTKPSTIYSQLSNFIKGKGVQCCIYISNVFMLVLTS